MLIRIERPDDAGAIRDVVRAAFEGDSEAGLIERLRADGDLILSLAAELDGRVVGHIGFSRLWIEHGGQRSPGVSLAPLAVTPELQHRGIGSALIEAGHVRLVEARETLAFVYGSPVYYGRFGYSLAAAAPFACVYAGPYFQALAFSAQAPTAGTVEYAPAFAGVE